MGNMDEDEFRDQYRYCALCRKKERSLTRVTDMPELLSLLDPQRDSREVYGSYEEVDIEDQALHNPIFVSQSKFR